jgi:glucose-6-phosphate dehydrogenase assembly protein OpcA
MTLPAPITVSVPLKDVDRELNRQIKLLQGPGDAPVQRARMANLIIFSYQQERADAVNAQLAEIVAHHPARVLLLVGDPQGDDRELKCTLTIRPVRLGRSGQAYGEQITLTAGGGRVDRLPFAVRSLIIGDLPVNLWWASPTPPPMAGPLLFELAEGAEQIMYDSIGWPDPARGVAAISTWLDQVERVSPGRPWRVASDINWRRLKYWRRLLVQSLAPSSAPGVAASASEVLIEHGPHAVVQAWSLASWLTLRLGWKVTAGRVQPGTEMGWRFALPDGGEGRVKLKRLESGPPEVRRVRIACKLGDCKGAINVTVESEVRLIQTLEGVEAMPRTITVPPHTPAELVGRQLSDRERSAVFRDSMAVAQTMAQSLLH